jgi:hypothetical protein
MVCLRSSVLTRFVVIGLLLWAATDLAFPQLCAEDSEIAAQASDLGSSGSSAQPDDCFCCCHHVVPGIVFALAVVVEMADQVVQPPGFPLRVVRAVFHPPLSI